MCLITNLYYWQRNVRKVLLIVKASFIHIPLPHELHTSAFAGLAAPQCVQNL